MAVIDTGVYEAEFPNNKEVQDFFALLREAKRSEWEFIARQMPDKGVVVAADRVDTDVSAIRTQYASRFRALLRTVQLNPSDMELLLSCRPDIQGKFRLSFSLPRDSQEQRSRMFGLLSAAGANAFSELLPNRMR